MTPRSVRWILVAIAALVVVTVVVVALKIRADDGTVVGGQMVATASSSSLGHAPSSALATEREQAGWQPVGDATGSWWQADLQGSTQISGVDIGQATGFVATTRVMLRFDDGTKLMARLDGAATEIEFIPRTARSVRIDIIGRSASTPLRLVGIRLVSTDEDSVPRAASSSAAPTADAEAVEDGRVVRALTDGVRGGAGDEWVSRGKGRAVVTIRFGRSQEIAGLELIGSRAGDPPFRGAIVLGGDRVAIGGVLADPTRPTQIAFPPHVVRSLRLELVGASPDASIRLAELSVLPAGRAFAVPNPDGARIPDGVRTAASCGGEQAAAAPAGFVLRCPQTGAALSGPSRILVDTPSSDVAAVVWDANGRRSVAPVVEQVGAHTVAVEFDAARLAAGPVSLSLSSPADSVQPVVLSFLNASTARVDPATRTRSSIGGRLVYAEEFDGPITASYDGSSGLYTAAKPEIDGVSSFGDAQFSDPTGPDGALSSVDGMLRLDVKPGSSGGSVGAMLASSRSGGSGFSAQYGYFEARMQLPIATGGWGAFWTLPSSNLAAGSSDVAEFDATEVYGHDPTVTCSATHHFRTNEMPTGETFCGHRWDNAQEATEWHTYGQLVLPGEVRFFVDGEQVAAGRQVPGGSAPMFFMADLALGGGWPVDLAASDGRIQAYVDWIRVYE